MPTVHEQLSQQFHKWEIRGRGWQIYDNPVSPEPTYIPFNGHYLPESPVIDDGRRPTVLSSLFRKLSGQSSLPTIVPEPIEEPEPEPELLERDSIVELHASLPPDANISKEAFEQFVLSLTNCGEPISFELVGTHESITVQLAASESDVELVRQQLEAHFPEAICIKQVSYLETKWNETDSDNAVIFEFGLSQEFMFQIGVARNFNVDPYIGLLGAFSNLHHHELALFQVIFQPVREAWDESILRSVTDGSGKDFFVNRPELSGEAKKKIARPLFAAVVRIAIKSDDRMLDIARDVAGALTVFANPCGNEFIPLSNSEYDFVAHEEDLLRRQSRRSGMILNSEELVSLVHLPSSSVRVPKLKREVQKTKAAPQIALNESGLLLGTNTYAGVSNEVRLTATQRVHHTYVIGASGTGKSNFLLNLIRQDLENDQGLAVFDPHGDLVDKILGIIPEHRIDDVVLVDPSDEEYAVGFNILSAHSELEKNLLASDLVSAFRRLSTSWGDQMGSVLNNAILAFLESSRGGTLADLQRFLIEPAFRNEFLKTVQDTQVLYYWKRAFPQLTGNKSIGPVLTRLSGFLDRKPIRYMVTQKENRLDFAKIMDTGKIFLAKLSQGLIGNENAYLLGSFLVSKFQQLAMSRQAQAAADRKDFWCYCDEFHNFMTPSMAQILNGARKYRLGLVLAHQELRQLQRESEVASAVFTNPYTRIYFRVGDDDAKKLAGSVSFFETRDIQSLPNYHAICRIERSDCDFNLAIPFAPEPNETEASEFRNRVITASREKYSVPRKQIEAEERAWLLEDDDFEQPVKKRVQREKPQTQSQEKPLAVESEPTRDIPEDTIPTVVAKEPEAVAAKPEQKESKPEKHDEPTPSPPVRDLGRGDGLHKTIQTRIQDAARKLNFFAEREKQVVPGTNECADVVLKRGDIAIAVEIAVTTTISHEFEGVKKNLDAGFERVVVLSTKEAWLHEMRAAVQAGLGGELASKVRCLTPDEFISELETFAGEAAKTEPPPLPSERVSRGYKVRRHAPTDPEENLKKQKINDAIAFEVLKEAMKKK